MMMSSFKDCVSILVLLAILLFSAPTFSAVEAYYYLHVESFRTEKNALQSAKHFQEQGLKAVVNREKLPDIGEWYRIYLGPFSTRQAAQQKAIDLKKRGIINYASIKKKDSLIASTVAIEEVTGKVELPQPTAKFWRPPPKQLSDPKAVPKVTRPSPETKVVQKETAPPSPVKKTREVKPVHPKKPKAEKGHGRNIPGGHVALGYKHIYREINTELTERLQIETNGGTTITPIPIDENIKNEFPTSMHQDTLYLKLGLTDYLEVFAEGGIAYDTLDEIGFVYGGGMRLNLFQTADNSMIPGFYAAVEGEYLTGEFEEEYTSLAGNKFERETEWQELSAKVEMGISGPHFTAYIGGIYFNYNEDTDRQQLDLPLGSSFVYQDELEQENDFGVYGGFSIGLTSALSIIVEGRAIDQESIFGALEYRF